MTELTPIQIDYRDRCQRTLGIIITDLIEESLEKEVSVKNPEKDDTALIETFVMDIIEKYLQHTGYSEKTTNFIQKALSLASEYVYLDDFYKNITQETLADDFQALDRVLACVNEQKDKYDLDRTAQIEKYQRLPELKRKFIAQKQFEFNEAEIQANDLITELRKDIHKHYESTLLEINLSLS